MKEYPDSILRVEYPADRPVAVLTLDAPPLNIVTIPTREHFAAVFREIEENDAIRAVIVRGAGDQNFSSGGDIAGFLNVTPVRSRNPALSGSSPKSLSITLVALKSIPSQSVPGLIASLPVQVGQGSTRISVS